MYSKFKDLLGQLKRPFVFKYAPAVIICFGVILRLRQYLFNRSLWFDESVLALIITGHSLKGLFEPFGPPIGFMVTLKYLTQILGSSEYVLRLFPVLCGVASVFLFYLVAKFFLTDKNSILLALSLFVTCGALIYYSSEVKQYSSDVAVILVLYLLTANLLSKRLNIFRIIIFGFVGAVAIWFSQPSLFLLAAIGLGVIYVYWRNKDYANIMRLAVVFALWTLSFITYYVFSLSKLVSSTQLVKFWQFAFIPFPPRRIADVQWIVDNAMNIFKNPVGISLMDLAAFSYLVGCISFYKKGKEYFIILFFPLFFVFIASALHKYPFFSRLLLFLVPSFMLFISEGTLTIINYLGSNSNIIKITLIGLLISNSLCGAVYGFIKPRTVEEIKPVLSHMREHRHESDVIYLHHGSVPAFKYYAKSYGFSDKDYILGLYSIDNYSKYEGDLDNLIGNKRVWVVFSHVVASSERAFIVTYLNRSGKQLDVFYSNKATVYLYDLSHNFK